MTETRRIAERTLLPQLGEVRIQGFAGTELIDVERAGLSRRRIWSALARR